MRTFVLIISILLLTINSYAYRSDKPPKITDFNESGLVAINESLEKLWNITNGRYSLDVVESDPNGSLKGNKGDLILYDAGATEYICVNTDGSATWINLSASVDNLTGINLLLNGATVGTSGVGVAAIAVGTIPTSSPADETQLYSEGETFSLSGGTETTDGADKIHTFNSSGTLTITGSGNVAVLAIGGGGGAYTGGGGGGGFQYDASYAVTTGEYSITVGAGGAGGSGGNNHPGDNSVFGTITANGGGGGGAGGVESRDGGCGGGGGPNQAGGTGSQGANGGNGTAGTNAGGGGGATAVGSNGAGTTGGNGGAGTANSISGASVTYAGGGGGAGSVTGSTGGAGGGGNGEGGSGGCTAGTANTGGGGGGGWNSAAAAGGSGIVIVRYTPTGTELKVRDGAGTVTTLSPHSFNNMPEDVIHQVKKDSKDLAWTYHSEKEGKEITVDMFNAIKDLEVVTGKKYIYNNEIIEQIPIIKPAKYFCKIEDNTVRQVVVADDKEWCKNNFGGIWVETFIDRQDKNYASKGFIYYPEKDNFSAPQPYPSWTLDENCDWQPPVEKPIGKMTIWNEEKKEWIDINTP